MTLEDIKKNLNAIANSILKNPKKNGVDSSVILLLTIASTLVLMMDELIKKDGKNESISEEE